MRLLAADLHLSANCPERIKQFSDSLLNEASGAKEVYLLGDLFDTWPGDDENGAWVESVCETLRTLAQKGVPVYIQHGNRDFLLGKRFCAKSQCQLLPDFHVLKFSSNMKAEDRFLLTHGDLLCADYGYHVYRSCVRNGAFSLLSGLLPLQWRRKLAANMADGSRRYGSAVKVRQHLALKHLKRFNCQTLIHGHTHGAGEEIWMEGTKKFIRHCLPDWESAPGYMLLHPDGEVEMHSVGEAAKE